MTNSILIVDDCEEISDLLRNILSRSGYDVHTASDAISALKILSETAVDLIVLDLEMPGINGLQLMDNLNEKKLARRIPVIMVSGNYEKENIDLAYAKGIKKYLYKPFEFQELEKYIENYLNN